MDRAGTEMRRAVHLVDRPEGELYHVVEPGTGLIAKPRYGVNRPVRFRPVVVHALEELVLTEFHVVSPHVLYYACAGTTTSR